jgi:hypothetical protein
VRRVFKHIAVFSLWLAGLVIIAHLMIPHDHHSDDAVFNKENHYHAENTKLPVKAPIFPIHCHALNDLTIEKASHLFFSYNDFPTCDLFTLCFFESVVPKSVSSYIQTRDFQNPVIETDFLRLSPFRAPPALA